MVNERSGVCNDGVVLVVFLVGERVYVVDASMVVSESWLRRRVSVLGL